MLRILLVQQIVEFFHIFELSVVCRSKCRAYKNRVLIYQLDGLHGVHDIEVFPQLDISKLHLEVRCKLLPHNLACFDDSTIKD